MAMHDALHRREANTDTNEFVLTMQTLVSVEKYQRRSDIGPWSDCSCCPAMPALLLMQCLKPDIDSGVVPIKAH